jgi:large subunit ribosomal protein L10
MNLDQKAAVVEDLKGVIASAKAIVLLSQKGLTVEQTTGFRRNLRKEGAAFLVVKNTLMARAVEGSPWSFLGDHLKGPLAIAFTKQDPAALAKALTAFLKGNQKVTVVTGALGTKPMDASGLKVLASLPSAEVLKSMLLGALVGVPKKFLGVLQAPARDFVGVLAARERQLTGEA